MIVSVKTRECPVGDPFMEVPIELSDKTKNFILRAIGEEIPPEAWLYTFKVTVTALMVVGEEKKEG